MLHSEEEQERAYLRRTLVPEVVYEEMPKSGTDEHYDTDTHVTSLTFMAGYHFAAGSKTWADLQRPARSVLAPVLNGYKHLAPNGKKLTNKQLAAAAAMTDSAALRLASVPLKWHSDVAIEVIPSAPDANKRVFCAGYRVHFIGHEQGGGALIADDQPADAPPLPPAGSAQTKARGNEMARALKTLQQDAREAPLATALAKSFAEAAALRDLVLKKRDEYIKSHMVKNGEQRARTEARSSIKEGRLVPEYSWEEFMDMDEFLYSAIKPYFNVPAPCKGAHPKHDPGNGFLHFYQGCGELDTVNDAIKATTRHKLLSDADYYVHPTSPLHPDYIFCLARSMAYFMRDGDYRAHRDCTQLSKYIPGAIGRPTIAAAPVQDAQTDSVESDDDDNDNNDADDAEDTPVVPDPMDVDLRRFIRGTGAFESYNHVVARGTWPFPGLVFKVNPLAAYAEVFLTVLPLPYAIGAEIPSEAFQTNAKGGVVYLPDDTKLHVARTNALRAAENLRRGEESAAEVAATATAMAEGQAEVTAEDGDEDSAPFAFTLVRATLPTKMKPTIMVRGRDGTMRRQVVSDVVIENAPDPTQNAGKLLDRQAEAERQAASQRQLPPEEELERLEEEEGVNGVPAKYAGVLEHHKTTVRTAISTLATRFRRMLYEELFHTAWEQRMEALSSDTFMPAAEFYPPHQSNEDDASTERGLARLRKQLASQRHKTGFTDADERIVFDSVELQPDWLKEREEPLEVRQDFQLEKATLSHKQAKERDALLGDAKYANDPEGLRLALWAQEEAHAAQIDKQKRSMYARGNTVYMETERLAPALKIMRDYTKHQVLPNRDKPRLRRPQSVSVRGFINVRQFYTDTYRSSELATKANCPFTERVHTCAFHALRWMPSRTDPALNYVMSGESGAGKSKALLTTVSLFPLGVVSDVASETTNSYNVDQNFDGYIVVYQEMPNDLLFANQGGGKGKDQGPSDKTNFAKARMTSFHTHTRFFKSNEQTGKREAEICNSSQHIVTMGATNQELAKMDKNMRRRLMIDIFAEAPTESEGSNPADMERPQALTADAFRVSDHASAEHRELAAGYAYVENAIKMGIIDDVLRDCGRDFLGHILERAADVIGSAVRNKGHRVWVIEAARILTIQHAVYETLFGLRAHALYAAGKYKRWSPQAFQYICEPQLGILKDAVIHALTMLDFLYSSQAEDLLLRTIAKDLLHVDEPHRWRFRVKGDLSEDYNYLSFVGKNRQQIHAAIVNRHGAVNVMRPEDIPVMLRKHMTKKHSSLGIEGVERDASGLPARLVPAQLGGGALLEERSVFIYEDDPTSKAAANKPQQFCMSVEFIQKLFDIDLAGDTPEQVRGKIELREPRIDADRLRAADPIEAITELHQIMECTEGRAPLVAAIKKALRMPTLECSPYEHPDFHQVPEELFKYGTFYLPPDVYIDFGTWEKRVPVDGASMFVKGKRDPDGDCIMQINYTKPLPTALSNFYDIHPGDSIDANSRTRNLPELSRGFIYNEYDIDYYTMLAAQRRQGYPGEPLFLELYTKALVHFRDERRHPNADTYRRQLVETIPELDPAARVPLPFAFPPIAYMIDCYLAQVERGWKDQPHYPVTNILTRLQDALLTTDAKKSKNANGAFEKQSDYHHCSERREFALFNIKRAREEALAGPSTPPTEDAPRPAKKARLSDNGGGEDAMDIDGPVAPAAASLQRHMPPRPSSPDLPVDDDDDDDDDADEEEEDDDDADMFTD
jgi:hypothetical protein